VRALPAAVLLAAWAATPARAWCNDGHRVVGYLAEERLTPAALAVVRQLLGPAAHLSDYDVASWADDVKQSRPETRPWHYVNIPLEAAGYDAARDCAHGDCVVTRVEMLARLAGDRGKSDAERGEALRFLVHLVADLHQPLHCAERANRAGVRDKGGNLRTVLVPGQDAPTNLHAVWDTSLVMEAEGVEDAITYAQRLGRSIRPDDARRWEKGTVTSWADEAHRVAADAVYRGVNADGPARELSAEYRAAGVRVVDEQLRRAGVRLAAILNRSLE
jgi:hypothetical protein